MDRRIVALHALSAQQDGQFTSRQAAAAGVDRDMLAWLQRSGAVVSLRHGVERFTHTPGDPDIAITAYLACLPYGVICRRSAAVFHRLSRVKPPPQPEVLVPHGIRCAPEGITVVHTRNLRPADILRVGPIAYTTLARTVLDIADPDDAWETLSVLDDAIAAGAKRAWIHNRATELKAGRAGVTLVHRATAPDAPGVFRSWLERMAGHIYRMAGIPDPEWNVPLYDSRGKIGVVDALWRPWRVVSEKEGLRFHTSPAERRRDARRFNRLLEAKYGARRFTWFDLVHDPVDMAATIHRALRAGGADLDPNTIPSRIILDTRPFL